MHHRQNNLNSRKKSQRQIIQYASNVNIFERLKQLTNQNQMLKTQLNYVIQQLERTKAGKNKYKLKYMNLKNMIQQQTNSKKTEVAPFRRQNSGKIYHQFKKQTLKSLQNKKIFVSKQKNLNKIKSQQSFNLNFQQQNPYNINFKHQAEEVKLLNTIDKKFQTILQFLHKLEKNNQSSALQEKIIKNSDKCQIILQKIIQLKSQLQVSQKTNKQKYSSRKRTYSSDKSSQNEQLNEDIQKNSSNCKNYQKNDVKIKQKLKSEQQKIKKSKSYKKFTNQTKFKYQKKMNKNEESQNQSTKSKWEMLNEIGKKLQNWKIGSQDYSENIEQQNQKIQVQNQTKQ